MRLLFVVNQYPPDPILGLQRKVLELADRLAGRGHAVTVLTRRPAVPAPDVHTESTGVRVIRVAAKPVPRHAWPFWPSLSHRWALAPLRELAKDQDGCLSFFPYGAWAARINPRMACVTLTGGTVRGADDFELPRGNANWKERIWRKFFRRQLRRLEQNCFRSADAVVAETGVVARQLTDLYGLAPDRIVTIPAGVDLRRFAPAEKKHARCTVLYVGRLDPIKNVDHLLRAVALCPRDLDLRLVVAGDGNERPDLERRARELGINDRTTFAGHVANVEDYYRRADIFVLPSRYEAQGNAALEAMAAGLPVLMLRGEPGKSWIASEEIIQDGENGFCSDADAPRQMAEQIERLARDPALRTRMGHAARRYVERYADWDTLVRRFEELIGSCRTKRQRHDG